MSAEGEIEIEADVEIEIEEEVEVEIEVDAEDAPTGTEKRKRPERKQVERLEDLKAVERPCEYTYLEAKTEAQDKLDIVLAKMAELTAQIDKLSLQHKSAGDARRGIQDKQAVLKSQRSEAYEKSNGAQEKLEEIEKQRAETRRTLEQHKVGLKFTKVEDLDNAVQKIQLKLTTAQLDRDVQQKLLGDLNSLKSQRQKVLAYVAMRQLATVDKVDTGGINKQIEKEADMTRGIREQERKLTKDFAEHRKVEQMARKQIDSLIKERKTHGKEKYEHTNAITNLERNYTRKERAYHRYTETVKFLKRKQAREERAARDKEWEEGTPDAEEEIQKAPYAKELQICDDLARYLTRLVGLKGVKPVADVDDRGDVVDIAASRNANFKGKQVTSRPEEKNLEDEWVSAARETFGGGKKKRVRNKKSKAILNHIPDIFNQFKTVEVAPPLLKSNVEATLEALINRKQYYETAPPPEPKAKKSPKKEADNASENKERTKNRHKSVQLADAEQQRRIDEQDAAQNAAEEGASDDRRASVKLATDAADAEKQRRVEEDEAVITAEKEERKVNQRRASEMLDEEQLRRVAENAKVTKEQGGSNQGDLTTQLQNAENARTGITQGGGKGKGKKGGDPKVATEQDPLTAQLQAAEKSRTK